MATDFQQQIDDLKEQIKFLNDFINKNEFCDLKVFQKKVLLRSDLRLMPSKNLAAYPNTAPDVFFYVGTAYDDTTIKSLVGTAGVAQAAGSFYISTNTTTPGIWILKTTTWTQLTIP